MHQRLTWTGALGPFFYGCRQSIWLQTAMPLMVLSVVLGGEVTPAIAQSRGVNYISDIDGQAEVDDSPVYVGDFVSPTAQLRVQSGGNVGIVCNNETRERRFPTGTYTVGDYCTSTSSARSGRRRSSRNFDANLPYLVSPRNTGLLSPESLTFTWHPVTDAKDYTVVLYQTNPANPDWTAQVSGTSITYDGPPLETDTRYRIEVTADNGLSSAADIPVGFTLLSEGEAERIEQAVVDLQAIELATDADAIGTALIYQGYRHSDLDLDTNSPLYEDALAVLQERIDAETDNSLIYLMQGDIYLATGLPLLAHERYEQSLDLATEAEQLRRQAESLEGLGLVAKGESQLEEAKTYLESAITLYQTLGDVEAANNLQDLVDILG